MARNEVSKSKVEISYELTKNRRFFRKARALVVKDKKLLLIRVDYKNGHIHYLLPGGGVDEGETIKQAIVRETLEEHNTIATPIKYMGKQYYNIDLERDGEKFVSHRVEYYYLCKFEKFVDNMPMGIGNEFINPDKTYTKVELSLDEILNLKPRNLNDMNEKVYLNLVEYLKSIQ